MEIKDALKSFYHALPFWFWAIMAWIFVLGSFIVAVGLVLYLLDDEEPGGNKPSPKARDEPENKV